jgi:hypothetical protein
MSEAQHESVGALASENGVSELEVEVGRAVVTHAPMDYQYPMVNGDERVVAIRLDDEPEGDWAFRMSDGSDVRYFHADSWSDACPVVYASLRAGFRNEDEELNDIFSEF